MYFDGVALFFTVVGILLLRAKDRRGFLCTVASCSCWLAWIWLERTAWGGVPANILCMVLALSAYSKWGRDEQAGSSED